MVDFNMFNYLKIKGFSNNQLAANFQEIDKEKKQLQFEIKIEVVNN